MKSLLKIGLLFSLIGVCSWFCLFFCTSEVMAEGIPYSTYGANGIYFYSPCWMSNGDDGAYGDGTSYKINPDTPPGSANTEGTGGFWYLEGNWSKYPETVLNSRNGGLVKLNTRIDSDFFDMPYIHAENFDFNYSTWPVTIVPNGNHSTRKYYWLVLPNEAYAVHMGDMYVAYFEKRKEPVFFILYDVWSCDDHYLRGMHYCDWAKKDPDNVNGGLANNSLGHFSERGSTANNQLGDALGKLTCLHRLTTEGATLARESASCSGSIDVGNEERGSKKEEKDAEKKDEEETDTEESNDKEESSSSDAEDNLNNEGTKAASSDTKLHKPTNEWLDKAGLEGFKIDKALNSRAGGKHIDTSAMTIGTDNYTSFASAAGDGAGLPGFIVLHWTAANTSGVSWTYFCGGDMDYYCPPHFAIDVVTKEIQQYFPLSSPSAAVAGSSENTWDQYGIQIEVVGSPYDKDDYGNNRPEYNIYNFTDDQYEYLAKLLIAISDETGIPLESSLKWTKGQEQGEETAPKLSPAETKKYIGVLGHEHLPDQAGKWDPGKMWEYLVPALERLGYKYNANGGSGGGKLVCAGDKNTSSCGGARIAEVARELAWPDDNHHNDIKPEYAKAATEVGIASAATNWDGWAGGAADCGRFVAVVVRKAADPDYPACCTGPLQQYMSTSSSWEEIPNNNSEDNLEPGDVMVVNAGSGEGANGHIYVYLGNGEQASASLNGYTGKIKQGVTFADSRGSYHIFRYVGAEDCEGDEGASIGSFDEDLKELEKDGGKVGVAVSAPGNKDKGKVKIGGSWKGGRAWSTIKVPLAIAAIQENVSTGDVTEPYGTSCTGYSLSTAVNAAITQSDNCAAWWLWVALGGDNSSAASKVTEVIRAGGDSSTEVNGTRNGDYLTSGMTDWLLVEQAIFAANMSSISKSADVLSAMRTHNASDGSHGLASNYTSMIKGGWGDSDGAATRQFGLIKLKNGKCSAVAIGTDKGSNFSMLDKIVKVLLNHEDDLPVGSCPEGL